MLLTSEEILDKIRKAFAPYHVVAELQDYHRQLRVSRLRHRQRGLSIPSKPGRDLKNPANLEANASQGRARRSRRQQRIAQTLVIRGLTAQPGGDAVEAGSGGDPRARLAVGALAASRYPGTRR